MRDWAVKNGTGLAAVVAAVSGLAALFLTLAAGWALWAVVDWTPHAAAWALLNGLLLAGLLLGLIGRAGWLVIARRTRIAAPVLRLLPVPLLCVAAALIVPGDADGYIAALLIVFIWALLLAFVGLLMQDRTRSALVNLLIVLVSIGLTLALVEWVVAAPLTETLKNAQREAAKTRAVESATAPLAEVEGPAQNAEPAAALTEFVGQPGPGPAWGELTGWGTNTDTVVHSWMDGVYDVLVEYNSLGFRGPEIPYDKPEDVYRILLVGDSYIEALQVDYAETIYAQLGGMLRSAQAPDGRRIEVFGVGATGWGTVQAYLYYHHEGYKFSPDLIVHFFVMNDVADNNPAQFYDYRDLDFRFEGDHVEVVHGQASSAETASSPGKRLLDALPTFLQNTRTSGLLRQLFDPPRLVVGLGGALEGVHPQNYIYVSYPEIEGYPEGWRRTQRAYEIWTREARANGAQLMVVQVDISAEKITELSTYFRDVTADWIWDMDLPAKRLEAILTPLNVPLIQTRDYYEAYAQSMGQRPFDALFFPQDWHWNAAGHRVTAQLLAETLCAQRIVEGSC